MNKINWKRKLTSRKLWVATAGFVAGLIVAFGGNDVATDLYNELMELPNN
jgi:hypothetical protein